MSNDDASAVVVHGARKTYGATIALDRVSVVVPRGVVYGVLGPNAAGKSTLLKALLGLVRLSSGKVAVLGRRPGERQALLSVGALIERPAFLPALSARQNLRVLARARGLSDGEVDRALAVVDLARRQNEAFRTYSVGMGQRLGVAAALLGSPQLLVLDEPTSGLDPEGVLAIRQLIRDKAETGVTVILSSHILSEVEKVCDRVLLLRAGKVLADGALADVLARQGRQTATLGAGPGPVVQAFLVQRGLVESGSPIPDNLTWRLTIRPDALPVLVHDLVVSGANVFRADLPSVDLEDAFLAMVHGAEVAP